MTQSLPTHGNVPGAVLFDLDGTLIDSEHLWLRAQTSIMGSLGAEWSVEDQARSLGKSLDRVAGNMRARSADQLSNEEMTHLLLREMEALTRAEPLQWRPGARELLREAMDSDIPRALVTSSWTVLVEAVSERLEQAVGAHAFTTVVAGDQVSMGKPDAEPYDRAARELGVPSRECLAIEDSPTGVRSAVAAGCRVVAVPHMAPVDDAIALAEHAVVLESLEGRTIPDLWRAVS